MASGVAITLDEARLRAHEQALPERAARREARRREGPPQRVMLTNAQHAGLPLLRVWMKGRSHRHLTWSVEEEIRERILEEELRLGVTPMWSDPYERFGVRRH